MNEAIREVLSEALPTLKDPRIGFVTVTGVETTTDLAGDGLRERARGRGGAGAHARGPASRRTACSRRRSRRELGMRRTPVLTFEYDPAVERGVRLTKVIDELAPPETDVDPD